MKKTLLILFIAAFGFTGYSQDSGIGIGVILGEPTGLSAKMWTSRTTAIDGAAAWSFIGGEYIHIHADFLLHNYKIINVDSGKLPLYFGLGGRLKLADNPAISVRVPFGIAYQFADAPFDAFLEIAPILDLLTAIDFNINGAIGLRYYL